MVICPTCNRLYRSAVVVCPSDGQVLAPLREWRPGDLISEKFRVMEKIGHGSMGAVFKAKLLPYGGLRALKPLAEQLADDEPLVECFRRNVQAASRLRHKHAIHIESLECSNDGRPFVVMEYYPGLSLRELMLQRKLIAPCYVKDFAAQVCDALECGHGLGIIHRNLKPDNLSVMEEHDGAAWIKVMEFGLAALREAAAEREKHILDVELTDRGPVVGVREYMSPEQAAGTPAHMLDGRSDLYSLGVVMFEALTGDLPTQTDNPALRLFQQRDASKNEVLFNAVIKALQNDPDFRYQSAAEMAADLREISNAPAQAAARVAGPGAGGDRGELGLNFGVSSTRIAGNRKEGALTPLGGRPVESPTPRGATASADSAFDEIRQSWEKSATQPLASRTKGKWMRAGLFFGIGLVLGSLSFWVAYQRLRMPSAPQVITRGDQQGVASPVGSPRPGPHPDTVSDSATHEGFTNPVRPDSVAHGPASLNHVDNPPGSAPANERSKSRTQTSSAQREYPGTAESVAGAGHPGNLSGQLAAGSTRPNGGQTVSSQEAAVKEKLAIGWFFVERKDYRAAIESFTEALEIDPSNVEAQAALRLAQYASQNPDVQVLPSHPPAAGEGGIKRSQ